MRPAAAANDRCMWRDQFIKRDWRNYAASIASSLALMVTAHSAEMPKAVYLVPNFHPACCGWLADWSTERNYCANTYLDHLDRVRDDPNYAFALSEVPNLLAILQFEPTRFDELKQRIKEGRVELCNAFFLEPTINLSGGEALVKSGVEGLRWQTQVLGARPRFAWMIDVTGMHEQMAQIVSGLNLEAMFYCRHNPTGSTVHWFESPDGTRALAVCPGHYSEWGEVFAARQPLSREQMQALVKDVEKRADPTPLTEEQLRKLLQENWSGTSRRAPPGTPVLILGGQGDYNLAPLCPDYPTEFLNQWKLAAPGIPFHFSTPGKYVDALLPPVKSGQIEIPAVRSGTKFSFNAFWIENHRVKSGFRRAEHRLQAAETLATIASLQGGFQYPVEPLSHAWLQMLLNMDRNSLWGSAGGMVFESDRSWDVRDRFASVEAISGQALDGAMRALLARGQAVAFFNPLNWKRLDPVQVKLPPGRSLAQGVCQELPGRDEVLCRLDLPSIGMVSVETVTKPVAMAKRVDLPGVIETKQYSARIDPRTGALASLKLKPSGREMLGGPANVIIAEKPKRQEGDPGDHIVDRPERERLASSSQFQTAITVTTGPLATVVEVQSEFFGGGLLRREMRFYHEYPRIDFETELNDIPDRTVVVAEFPLAEAITEVRRGIPYGFSHGAWRVAQASSPAGASSVLTANAKTSGRGRPENSQARTPALSGWTKGIVPAVRWSHYSLAGGGGVAILDRGLSGRELNDQTPILYLLNATDKYYGYPNSWLSGQGKHRLSYALVVHETAWAKARIPQRAWEFNCPPEIAPSCAPARAKSFVQTSDNVIVEVVRREGRDIELRLAECLGLAGTAAVKVSLPHKQAALTDLLGGRAEPLLKSGPAYRFPIRPQQIVTMRFRAKEAVADIEPLLSWEPLVPEAKRKALNTRLHKKGHPPRGDAPHLPPDSASSVALKKKITASNVYHQMIEHGPDKAVDDNESTRWATDEGIRQAWLEVDLGAPLAIGRVYLSEAYDRVQEFELQCRRDGQWQTFVRGG